MPELPEVETMVRGIRPAAESRIIERVEFIAGKCRPLTVRPASKRFATIVAGRQIQRVRRIAKRIVIDLDFGQSMVIEPRMTGLMLIAEPPSLDHRRVIWHLRPKRGRPDTFEFWDRRGLGTVSLLNQKQLDALCCRLGPDALDMQVEEWGSRLSATDRPVKVALLDQSLVAGIGNLYASEILHEAGMSPRKRSSKLTPSEVAQIAEATCRILREAIRYEGSTLGDGTYRNALNKSGGYQNKHRVYQRAGELCPSCRRSVIRRIVQTQRATFYCPACQRDRKP